jgi:hypothetical protein
MGSFTGGEFVRRFEPAEVGAQLLRQMARYCLLSFAHVDPSADAPTHGAGDSTVATPSIGSH